MDRQTSHSIKARPAFPNRYPAKKGFTLAEMIAAIALLAICSVIVVQLFAASHTLARRADRLDGAVLCARNLAERWQSGPQTTGSTSAPASTSSTSPSALPSSTSAMVDVDSLKPGTTARFYYDEQFALTSSEAAVYLVDLTLNQDPLKGSESLLISIQDPAGKSLFKLTAARLARTGVKS